VSCRDKECQKVLCLSCHHLLEQSDRICPYCSSHLAQRKPFSLALTWSYVIASILFLFPANLFFMMKLTIFDKEKHSTIISGIEDFINGGDVLIGCIIFIASIAVPIFKIAMLIYMLLIVHFKWHHLAYFALRIYKFIHFIGKWSMLDVFVVAISVSMIQYGRVIHIDPMPAIFAFSAVVILTILATESFDTRLMFDKKITRERK